MPRTLILGIGNTLLSDEGLGIHLLAYLRARHPKLPGVSWVDGGTLSFTLAPLVESHENLIVLDCAQLHQAPGAIQLFQNKAMDAFLGEGKRSVHEVGLLDLLTIAQLQGRLPVNRALLGIQPEHLGWGERAGVAVSNAFPEAADKVMALIRDWASSRE